MKTKQTLSGLAAILILAAVPAPAWAQNEIRTVTHVQVKSDKVGDFTAAVKEMVALYTKAGVAKPFTMWQALTGTREFVVAAYSSKWAEMDQTMDPRMKDHQGAMSGIGARLNAAAESIETEIHAVVPDLNSPQGKAPPPFVRTGRTTVAAGKMDEVLALFKNEVVPAWKKSGVTDYGVYRIRYGAPTNQMHTFTAMKGWADLDSPSPLATAMDPEPYRQLINKINALTLRTEYTVYRFRPELSYMPAAK